MNMWHIWTWNFVILTGFFGTLLGVQWITRNKKDWGWESPEVRHRVTTRVGIVGFTVSLLLLTLILTFGDV